MVRSCLKNLLSEKKRTLAVVFNLFHVRYKQDAYRTSLGIFKPKEVRDLVWVRSDADWKPSFKAALSQQRLWENRKASKEPPRKVPWKFQYKFACDDPRCKGTHQMMIEDWEIGALYWRCIDGGASPAEACQKVRLKFLERIRLSNAPCSCAAFSVALEP